MKLVEGARQSWRWISMQCMTLAGSLQGAWLTMPEDLKTKVPGGLVHWLTIALLVAGVAGRLVQQAPKAPK